MHLSYNSEEGSEITSKPLNKLNIPKDSIIAMINHHGKIGVAQWK